MNKITVFIIMHIIMTACNAQTPQNYVSFQGDTLSLYSWQGNKIMLLSSSNTLNPITMLNWTLKMDTAYNYYALCNGHEPIYYYQVTYINNRSTIAEVPITCGAGCGYLGWTGIEMETSYFMNMYNYIDSLNLYDQVPFYELGRNFWFYDAQLKYQTNDPIVTGYAVFMRFMAMESANVQGAPFNSWTFTQFKNNVINLVSSYMADTSLNWSNTLGIGQGVPGSNLGATDLFASFCFYMRDNNCGNHWVQNIWKFASLRPNSVTTQDAVDNFIIASSQAANTNLTSLFQFWKWPVSNGAILYLNSLNLGIINLQPNDTTINSGSNAPFSISSSDSSAYFQWQVDNGSGFQNVINGGQYSGASTNSLLVSNVTLINNNDIFRCIVTVGTCTDTSAIASLYVNSSSGIIEATNSETYTVFPSPAEKYIYVKSKNNNKANFKIKDTFGKNILTGVLTDEITIIDISTIKSGLYFIEIYGENKRLYKIIKE